MHIPPQKSKKYKIEMIYISAPKYSLSVTSSDPKSADKILQEISDFLTKEAETEGCEASWQKKS